MERSNGSPAKCRAWRTWSNAASLAVTVRRTRPASWACRFAPFSEIGSRPEPGCIASWSAFPQSEDLCLLRQSAPDLNGLGMVWPELWRQHRERLLQHDAALGHLAAGNERLPQKPARVGQFPTLRRSRCSDCHGLLQQFGRRAVLALTQPDARQQLQAFGQGGFRSGSGLAKGGDRSDSGLLRILEAVGAGGGQRPARVSDFCP